MSSVVVNGADEDYTSRGDPAQLARAAIKETSAPMQPNTMIHLSAIESRSTTSKWKVAGNVYARGTHAIDPIIETKLSSWLAVAAAALFPTGWEA